MRDAEGLLLWGAFVLSHCSMVSPGWLFGDDRRYILNFELGLIAFIHRLKHTHTNGSMAWMRCKCHNGRVNGSRPINPRRGICFNCCETSLLAFEIIGHGSIWSWKDGLNKETVFFTLRHAWYLHQSRPVQEFVLLFKRLLDTISCVIDSNVAHTFTTRE